MVIIGILDGKLNCMVLLISIKFLPFMLCSESASQVMYRKFHFVYCVSSSVHSSYVL